MELGALLWKKNLGSEKEIRAKGKQVKFREGGGKGKVSGHLEAKCSNSEKMGRDKLRKCGRKRIS